MILRTEPYYKSLIYWKNQRPPLKGKKFDDSLFPPNENSLLSKDNKGEFIDKNDGPKREKQINVNEIRWLRASEIFQNQKYSLFEDKIEIGDINQGVLGDSYFFASCEALTEYPNIIYQIFKTKKINEEGYFEVIFFIDGKFQIVLVDDYLPVNKNTKKLCFSSPNNNQIWVCILEKAWAKINGGYTNIIKGRIHQVLETITGFPSVTYKHNITRPEVLWDAIFQAKKRDCILTCFSRKEEEENSLVNPNAYSIVDCKEIKSKGNNVKLLQFRNTWGNKKWTGDWNDKSPLWGPNEKKQVNWENKKNGNFFMSFEDYFQNYLVTDICSIIYESYSKSYIMAGNSLNNGNIFNIYLESDGYFSVSLIRKKWKFSVEVNDKLIPSYLAIVKYDPEVKDKDKFFTDYDARNESFENTTLTKYLKKGYYLIYTYHDLSHSTLKNEEFYIVKFDSNIRFKHRLMSPDSKQKGFPLLKNIIIQSVLDLKRDFKPGEKYSSFVSQFMKDGLSHRIVYNNTSNWLCYKEDSSEIKNIFMLSPYDDNNKIFEWYIPPGEFNCILGMCLNSKEPLKFSLKASYTKLNDKPNEYFYNLNIDEQIYASDNVSKNYSNYDSYYDYITLSLEETKKKLQLNKLELSKTSKELIEKEYPEIIKKLDSLPKVYNDKDLSWVFIPGKTADYVGQINKINNKEGKGSYILKNSENIILGIFREGLLNGKCFIYNKSLLNLYFEGNYLNGKKNGKGIHFFSNGDKYEGNFVDDKRNGFGTYFFANGAKWKGQFVENSMDGEGTFTNPQGKESKIKYVKGRQVK